MNIFKILLRLHLFFILALSLGCSNPSSKTNQKTIEKPSKLAEVKEASKASNPNKSFHMKLWENGVDFYARGNEPFWSLDMDFEKKFAFKTLDGFELNVPPVKGEKAMDANITRYYAEVESGSIIITIREEKCSDSMADRQFSHSVRVEVKPKTDAEYLVYNGCGQFVPDYGLHDIWALVSISGEPVSKSDTQSVLEFHVEEGKVLGNTGCNAFNGTFSRVGQDVLQFSDMAITKKLCKEAGVENLLIKSVFGRRVKYLRENLNVKILGYGGMELIFKKVD